MLYSETPAPVSAFGAAKHRLMRSSFNSGRKQLSIGRKALPIYFPADSRDRAFDLSKCERRGWRFLVSDRGQLAASVRVYGEEDDLRVGGVQITDRQSGFSRALEAFRFLDDEPEPIELRVLEIPNLRSLFLWATGAIPRFIDAATVGRLTEFSLVDRIERLRAERYASDEPGAAPTLGGD